MAQKKRAGNIRKDLSLFYILLICVVNESGGFFFFVFLTLLCGQVHYIQFVTSLAKDSMDASHRTQNGLVHHFHIFTQRKHVAVPPLGYQ